MSTFDQLTQKVLFALQGYTMDQEQRTFITSNVLSTDLSFPVDDSIMISQGMCEIGDELVWVKSIDNAAGNVAISPFGRGYRGTVAAGYPSGTEILNNPRFPRYFVKDTINTTIKELYPDLYVIKSFEFPYVAARSTYGLPSDCLAVHQVTWQTIGPSLNWAILKRWQLKPNADTTAFPTGKAIDIWQPVVPGRSIKVDYIAKPSTLVNGSDDFPTVSGFSDQVEECVVYGSCYRMSAWIESPRLQVNTIEATLRSPLVQPGSATNLSKYFFGLYQTALQTQRTRLLREYPNLVHLVYG